MDVELIKDVAVIGMGIMGPDIAFALARGGVHVSALSSRQSSLDNGKKRIESNCANLLKQGLIDSKLAQSISANVKFTLDWHEGLCQADFITEAVTENLGIKQETFVKCEQICKPTAIIASNTSSISMDEISSVMTAPERAVITHWFIPAHIMPVIEVAASSKTSPETVSTTKCFLERIGKTPVLCKQSPAFVHNYIQAAMIKAAVSLVEKGICSPADIDTIIENGFALRLPGIGPIRMADYAGIDTALALLNYVYSKTQDKCFEPPQTLIDMVSRGETGLKSRKGFYEYSLEDVQKLRLKADQTVISVLRAMGKI